MGEKRFNVVITDCDHGFIDPEREVMESIDAELILRQLKTEEEVIAACKDTDGLINQYTLITGKVMENLPRCKVIARYGVGVDSIDIEAATERGIIVANVPDYGTTDVANHAAALLLTCYRKIMTANNAVKTGTWDYQVMYPIEPSRQSTVGLLGIGRIGRAFTERMLAFDFTVIANDPYVTEHIPGIRIVDFDTLLAESDFISIHCPLTNSTYHLLGEKEFEKMKNTAVIVNTARGALIDEAALIRALQKGWIAGAALDVLEKEPPDPANPLLTMDNVIITPHAAWFSVASRIEVKKRTAQNVAAVLQGIAPKNIVNPEVLGKTRANIAKP
ncbi:MAG: C-terminal binding protein [Deltaproteobacteria bacterium]|nr:C-terminal binding protein [Deltaproteobacteria bacterium]MBW2308238.1 C-terminal binding protein [Deltaproteobacteria bacterium]